MKIINIKSISRENEEVYNLETEDNHNYYVNSILVSNCHQLKKSNSITNYVQRLKSPVKLGMTGTLPDSQEDVWSLFGTLGPVLHEEEIFDLQKEGYISNVKIRALKFVHKNKPEGIYRFGEEVTFETMDDARKAFMFECSYIESCDEINKTIVELAKKLPGNILVLFDHIEHGQRLFELSNNEKKYFIDGSVAIDVREDVRSTLEKSENVVVIANCAVFGTGISVKKINNIIFAMSGKGTTKIIQAIGRGLRLHESKEKLLLIDTFHNYRYSTKHFNQRLLLYEKNYKIKLKNEEIKSIEID